jgi:long-chain fatty acid transport protein
MSTGHPSKHGIRCAVAGLTVCAGALVSCHAFAGGIILYEVGTADVGLASAGYNARAQDASTVLTNPAGMTRLEGSQVLLGGQILWSNTKFSPGSGTSPALGGNDGGYAVGSNGWFPGGGVFFSHSASPDLKLGFAATGNFGLGLKYDDNWVGRYYVQETTLVGITLLPSIAYKVNDKLSLGASVNAMYGKFKDQVAINNLNPLFGDGRLKLDDSTWGWGANLGLLYEFDPGTRFGLTWNSQVDLDFGGPAQWANLAPRLSASLASRGLLDASIDAGIKVPQQAMASLYTQVNDRWALLGSVGWQQWSKFGLLQLGIQDSRNPTSISLDLDFEDTWHVALGAQYRVSEPWLLSFGMAYDSGFYSGSDVSPVLPVGAAWRFGLGGQQQLSKSNYWGIAAEYVYGGTLDVNKQGDLPVVAGGRGDLVGSYENVGILFLSAYYNWKF